MDEVEKEFEISYTFTFPQDMLYLIKNFLDKHFSIKEEYVEVLDKNNVRSRIFIDGTIKSVKKSVVESGRCVVPLVDGFVPMIERECDEKIYHERDEKIKRICKTRVYQRTNELDNAEIKFEHIYYEYSEGDFLDPLTANKQIALYNLLKPTEEINTTNNSHLGSDEILCNCRVEFEYDKRPEQNKLIRLAELIQYIEYNLLVDTEIQPFLSHTNIFNEIMYRSFTEERLITDNCSDVVLWALKLDGTRGKGYVVNDNTLFIQLDDMQMFSNVLEPILKNDSDTGSKKCFEKIFGSYATSPVRFSSNRLLGVQVEYVCSTKTFYVTDVLNVYKYTYDNKNQFDVSAPYHVNIYDAMNFMTTSCRKEFKYGDYIVKFQRFYPCRKDVEEIDLNDGYIGLLQEGDIVKIKHCKSFEMKYMGKSEFISTTGVFKTDNCIGLEIGSIYEVKMSQPDENKVCVIKKRPDRLLFN
ncbi:ORF85 [Agrotis segetum granulovirus]|uniref:Lef-4 n=1 Tax=Agrotis segetum granulosis virus TaxID=10464 RepID=Q6QXM5_GVAS|nr:lef-4 [Agrotis segetum granulovirus]AAS82653.1 ORF85 [Agrotis segetum granulovirus]AHN92136.1 lef-4 [Agrotis segetum granulovirus]AKN63373.1 lef-4 [Agrotis segetum granulovirus]